MKKRKIGVGVIGFGSMGRTIEAIKNVPDLRFEIRAVCAQHAESLRQRAEQASVPFWTTEYQELVQRNDVDVVVVYSPDHLHTQHALAAVRAGKHVVCGKPSGTTLDEVRELVIEVRKQGIKFSAAYTWRQDQQYLAAKKMLDDGELGNLIALEAHYIHDMRDVYEATPWRLHVPQDMMFGGCMHAMDILRAIGGNLETVHAFANRGGLTQGYPIADNFFINLKFQSGIIGRVSGLYGVIHPPLPMNQFAIYGSSGTLVVEYGPLQMRLVLDKLPGHKPFVANYTPEPESARYWYGPNIIRYMWHLQECIDNHREPVPDVVDSARSVAVGVAAWESIRTGEPVQVCNDF